MTVDDHRSREERRGVAGAVATRVPSPPSPLPAADDDTAVRPSPRTTQIDEPSAVAYGHPDAALEAIVDRLQRRVPSVPGDRIRASVEEAAGRLARARVTQYLPVLIERIARDEIARQEPH